VMVSTDTRRYFGLLFASAYVVPHRIASIVNTFCRRKHKMDAHKQSHGYGPEIFMRNGNACQQNEFVLW
jgi:hypothetical protein